MKKIITRQLVILVLAFVFAFDLHGQLTSFENVNRVQMRNMGSIKQGPEVKGYFAFYMEDKLDRSTNQYRLRLLDANMKEIANEVITGPRSLYLLESTFNGANIVFKFVDVNSKVYQFRIYDTKAAFVKQVDTKATSFDITVASSVIERGEIVEGSLFSVAEKGFVNLKMTHTNKYGYEIQYFGKDRSFGGWTYVSDPESKMVEIADFVLADEKLLLIQVLKRKSFLSNRNMDAYLLGIDIETGKKKFENKLADATNSFFLLNGLADTQTDSYFLFGQHTLLGDNSFKDKSLGFCGLQVDAAGKFLKTTKVSWTVDVGKFLPVTDKGKIEDVGYIYFHQIIRLENGNVYAIGEQYSKTVSAVGVAATALGGSAGLSQITVKDMMIFEFSPDFKLQGVSIFEKRKSRVQLPQGAEINGPQLLAHYVKAYGGFDYSFTQVPLENNTFSVFFQEWEKEKGEKGRMTLKSVSLAEEGYALDQIDLATEATSLIALPAKPGYVLIMEYFHKLKKLDSRLEKFNR